MNTDKIILVGLLASILIVSFLIVSRLPIQNNISIDFCYEISFAPLRETCLLVFSKEIDSCNIIEQGYDKLCYEIIVERVQLDQEICDGIENGHGKSSCYSRLALASNNPDFCQDTDCIYQLAEKSSDSSLCDLLEIDSEIQKCVAVAFNNKNYCEEIGDEIERTFCFSLVPRDIDDCRIFDTYDSKCVTRIAKESKNKDMCSVISDQNEVFRWSCIVTVTNKPEDCEAATDFFDDVCKITYLRNNLDKVK